MILYNGNSGQRSHWREEPARESRPAVSDGAARHSHGSAGAPVKSPAGLGAFTRLLPEKAAALETEDLILLLILYLMYRESGDSELLMIMGAMFLL